MRHELEYGPVAKGIFAALIAFFPVFAMVWPQHAGAYVFFLLFLLKGGIENQFRFQLPRSSFPESESTHL